MKQISCFLVLLLLFICPARAQKVGLVLSGGGAKGLAHIGVIKALEENNIPIDYVAGTSMGAIVAGLYAAGYSVGEMEKLFRSEQFKFWSTGEIQEEYRYFFRKLEDTPAWLSMEMKKEEDKLRVLPPTNIIPEEQMDFAFMEMFSSTNAVCNYDFNNLFVPFLCIATDVHNNREVVLRNGDLGEAIRASMTFPFYFKPIEIDGNLVFDGGIVNNFPAKNMKEIFNPDFMIGHNVSNNADKPEQDDLMAQLQNLIMQKTDYRIQPQDGIFLESTFTDIGLLDFKKIDQIEADGYKTAISMIDSIKLRVSRRISPEKVNERRSRFNYRKPQLLFKNIQVEGVADAMQRKFIIQSLKHRSNIVELADLKKEYFKLVADPQIKSIRPISRYNEESGYFDLHLKVTPEKPVEIKFGGNVSTKPVNQGFVSLDYMIFKNRAYTLSSNMYFGRFYSSFLVGGRIDYPTALPFYISAYMSLNRWDFYSGSTEFVFEDVRPPYIIQEETNFRAEIGFPYKNKGKFTIGSAFANSSDEYYLKESVKRSDTPDNTRFDSFISRFCFEQNSLNYKQFATEGIHTDLSLNFIAGTERNKPGTTSNNLYESKDRQGFFLLKGHYSKYFNSKRKITIGMMAEGVYSTRKVSNNYVSTLLFAPAFEPLPHSKTIFLDQYRANKYLAAGAKGIFKVSDQLHFRVEAYGFVPVRTILEGVDYKAYYNPLSFSDINFIGAAAAVYHTKLGPISLSFNYYDKENTRLYALLNFGYILFNKRGY
ncbi:MAG: patatin-like phospholipase family protein [Prolixibacteraceae bacterium]|jgi:NTE family protein|nr:patatin-like phospholipase family protein [Prolixibacteraceae bacterium]